MLTFVPVLTLCFGCIVVYGMQKWMMNDNRHKQHDENVVMEC